MLGDLAAHRDPSSLDPAEAHYRRGLAIATELGAQPVIAHCHRGLGVLHRRIGDGDQARRHLTAATAMYREMAMTFWLEKAETELVN
jgi:hypothetical protein